MLKQWNILAVQGKEQKEGDNILSEIKNQRYENQYCLKFNNRNIINHHKAPSIPLGKMHLGATSDLMHFC